MIRSCMNSATDRCIDWQVKKNTERSLFWACNIHSLFHWGPFCICDPVMVTGQVTAAVALVLWSGFTERALCLSTLGCGSHWVWPRTQCSWSCCRTGSVLSCNSCSISLAILSQTNQHLWTGKDREKYIEFQ